jgi:hypothetical protein
VTWSYESEFSPIDLSQPHPVLAQAEDYLLSRKVGEHDFFSIAADSRSALILWVSQELVVTNRFSMYMMKLGSQIANVHIRAALSTVLGGEHMGYRDGLAQRSHPWYLHQLRNSLGLEPDLVEPLPETRMFLGLLDCECGTPLRGVAAIGVGNERFLVEEYGAVRRCFEQAAADSQYAEFLDANIEEDTAHANLMNEAAQGLINQGGDPADYLDAARLAVDSRLAFYDRLVERISRQDHPLLTSK